MLVDNSGILGVLEEILCDWYNVVNDGLVILLIVVDIMYGEIVGDLMIFFKGFYGLKGFFEDV